MEDVITFDKSLDGRLREFNRIFPEECRSLKHLKMCLQRFLLLNVSEKDWKAMWKIPRPTCQHKRLPYPTFAMVWVRDVNFKDMSAEALITAVQQDVSVPENRAISTFKVPLIELYPTKGQESDMSHTADALDSLRFFYTHTYMPWDREEDDDEDWRSKHFENRLRLYYNLKNGAIPEHVSTHIESLLSEVRWLGTKKSSLETTEYFDGSKTLQLNLIKLRFHEIRPVIEHFSDPHLLDIAIDLHFPSDGNPKQTTTWAISNRTYMTDVITFFEKIDQRYPSLEFRFEYSLQAGSAGDGYLLDRKKFVVDGTVVLEKGGSIEGIDSNDRSVLVSNVENVMINFTGDATIEGVVINSGSTQCAVLVSSGKAVMKNCTIIGVVNDTTVKGIVVSDNAELELIDCELELFYASVVCKPHSKVTMRNCRISSSTFGVQACDNSIVVMDDVNIINCEKSAIVVETEDDVGRKVGGIEILQMSSGFAMKDVHVPDGVLLRQKMKLIQLESLQSDVEPEESAATGEDEDMECDR